MVDLIRTSYKTQARLWLDSTETVEIRWFRAPADAMQAPQGNFYVSSEWDAQKETTFPALGDVWGAKRQYDGGNNVLVYRGQNACGPAIAWKQGGRRSRDPVITTDANGSSPCCFAPGQLGTGGIGWGGGQSPIITPAALGGGLGGGSVTVTVTANAVATGGALGGGISTSSALAAAHATGGGLGGGTLFDRETAVEHAAGGGLGGGSSTSSAPAAAHATGGGLGGGEVVAFGTASLAPEGGGLGGGQVLVSPSYVERATGGGLGAGSSTSSAPAAAHATGGGLGGGTLFDRETAVEHAAGGGLGGGSSRLAQTAVEHAAGGGLGAGINADPGGYTMQSVWGDEGVVQHGSVSVSYFNDAQQIWGYYTYQSPAAINDERWFSVLLPAGSFTLHLVYTTASNRGTVSVTFDSTVLTSALDTYSAGLAYDVLASYAITVGSGGLHTVKIKVVSKNASSSDYSFSLTKIWFS